MNILREADHVILGMPMLTCMAVGAGSGLLQQSNYEAVKAAGWLGTHAAIVLGVVAGVPLLIYSIAKVVFANALHELTLRRFDSIKSFKEHAELQLNITIITVSALPVIVLALPHLVQGAYKAYQTYQDYVKVYEDFLDSDTYKALHNLYIQLSQFFNNKGAGLVVDETDDENQPAVLVEVI